MVSPQPVEPYSCRAVRIIVAVLGVLLLFGMVVSPCFAKRSNPSGDPVTSPVRIDLTHQGNLLLSDYLGEAVLVLDPLSLTVKQRVNVTGRPVGVAGNDRVIYVGNESTASVEVYRYNGKMVGRIGNGTIRLPNDLAVDHASGQLFVLDAASRKVRLFNVGGEEVGGIPADGEVPLRHPTALTLDQEKQLVYVSDQDPDPADDANASVHVYSYDGIHRGRLVGAFSRPQGLTINPDGYLYLADGLRGQVLVFDLISKTLIKTIGSSGSAQGQLLLPLDVVILPDTADLVVTNNRNGRLELFPGGGIAP